MDGGAMDGHWRVRYELNVRPELKARDLCQPLHTTHTHEHGITDKGF